MACSHARVDVRHLRMRSSAIVQAEWIPTMVNCVSASIPPATTTTTIMAHEGPRGLFSEDVVKVMH